MKRIIFAVLAMLLMTTAAQAQLKFGIKGGLNSSNIKFDDITFSDGAGKITEGESVTGYHLGLQAQVKIPIIGIYVQPELLYTKMGGKISVEELGSTSSFQAFNEELSIQRLDVPIMIGWRFGAGPIGFRPYLGPVASIMLKDGLKDFAQRMTQETSETFEAESKGATWGYQVGAGVDLWKLSADVRYEGSFSGFAKDVAGQFANEDKFDSRTSQVVVSVGYWF
ncbi:outer membrane beta-barrel protein [Limibacter armeniacum]|uniref:outer membrane beta-barrel protein n=1 Tax=Limibacter armeniacum TaxID=466084 RepID=UPI002FE5B80A